MLSYRSASRVLSSRFAAVRCVSFQPSAIDGVFGNESKIAQSAANKLKGSQTSGFQLSFVSGNVFLL